jgi:hypothetical protein
VNRLVAKLLLSVSHEEHFTESILADLNESIEMLNNFGFPIYGDVAPYFTMFSHPNIEKLISLYSFLQFALIMIV